MSTEHNNLPVTVFAQPPDAALRGFSTADNSVYGTSRPETHAGASAYLHTVRRRWLAMVLTSIPCAAAAAMVTWFLVAPTYTAVSLIQLAPSEQTLAFDTVGESRLPNSFEVFRGTQKELIKAPFVLTAALRKPNVSELDVIKAQRDSVGWLWKNIKVQSLKDSELMQVSLSTTVASDAAALVNAVVDAYLTEAVAIDQTKRRRRLSDLEQVHGDKEALVRGKRTTLKQLVEQLGTGDPQALSVKQQVLLQQFGEVRKSLQDVQMEIRKLESEIKPDQALLDAARKDTSNNPLLYTREFLDVLRSDRSYQGLTDDLTASKLRDADLERTVVPGARAAAASKRANSALTKQLEELIRQRRTELEREFEPFLGLAKLEQDISRRQLQVAILRDQEKQIKQEVAVLTQSAAQIGNLSTEVEMSRAEIKELEEVLSSLAKEKEQLSVELRAAPRVSVIQPAAKPEFADVLVRLALAGFAGLGGLAVPLLAIGWRDTRAKLINQSQDVSGKLGVSVLGSVPLIPARVTASFASPRKQDLYWHSLLSESINGIAARLLRTAEHERTRVILVTSAITGEGKTTIAAQLAMSLARTGRRTALVDFDLRRPTLNTLFKLPLQPGISEILRGEAELPNAAQSSVVERLSIVPAGQWDPAALCGLSNGATAALFAELRSEYDWIVVDTSPLLPIADARFICPHADAAVLTVLRDVSRAPQVHAACEILDALDVRILGAVVAETSVQSYYHRDARYQPQPSA